MSGSPVVALRRAMRVALLADAALSARLGANFVFDEAPAHVTPPYICFADVASRDWSTCSDSGDEHTVTLDVWSQHHGVREAAEIAELARAALDDASLALVGHRLVSLRFQTAQSAREKSGRYARVSLKFRAVTERL